MASFEKAFRHHEALGPVHFAGRARELAWLGKCVLEAGNRTVILSGPPGIGKSQLAREFGRRNADRFTGGLHWLELAPEPELIRPYVPAEYQVNSQRSQFIVLEDRRTYSRNHCLRAGALVRRLHPKSTLVVTTSRIFPSDHPQLVLGPLAFDEMEHVWASLLVRLESDDRRKLFEKIGGNARAGVLAGISIRDGYTTVADVEQYFSPFRQPGLVGPDGRSLSRANEDRLVSGLVVANEEVLRRIKIDPHEMFRLTPRQFEEFVATLLEREGYEVTLTPAAKDGGKDIYVAQKHRLGSLLYLVECKAYGPKRPVGVRVVRELYGVVQADNVTGGIVVTTSSFTKGAREFAGKVHYRLSLKDYIELRKWLDGLHPK